MDKAQAVDENVLLQQMVEAIRRREEAPTEELLAGLSAQPFSRWPIEHPDGTLEAVPVFKGLRSGMPPLVFGGTYMVSSVALSPGAVRMSQPVLEELRRCNQTQEATAGGTTDPFLPVTPIRELLDHGQQMVRDLVRVDRDGDVAARRRVEDWVELVWRRTIEPVVAPETPGGAKIWTSGAEGALAHGVRAALRHARLLHRLRVCKHCGEVLFTSLRGTRIREVCSGCHPWNTARDERKLLREVLRCALCPSVNIVVEAAHQHGCGTAAELRSSTQETWLREAVEEGVRDSHARLTEQRSEIAVQSEIDGILRRIGAPPIRGREGLPAWGSMALSELGLVQSPIPTDSEISEAGDRYVTVCQDYRGQEGVVYAARIVEDARAVVRFLRRQPQKRRPRRR